MMTKEEFLTTGLLEKYALGLTSSEENDLVIGMLKKYPDLQSQCDGIFGCMEKYISSQAVTPPEGLKGKVENTIDEYEMEKALKEAMQQPDRKGIVMSSWSLVAMAASFIGLLAFGYTNWNQKNNTQSEITQLNAAFDQFKSNCAEYEQQKQILASQNNFLQDPLTTHIHLRGSALAPEALVVAFWNPNKENAYLKILNLPVPPKGKTYQLWADIDNKMVNMGTFECQKEKLIDITYMAEAASLNITLEDEGGAEHPNVAALFANGVI